MLSSIRTACPVSEHYKNKVRAISLVSDDVLKDMGKKQGKKEIITCSKTVR